MTLFEITERTEKRVRHREEMSARSSRAPGHGVSPNPVPLHHPQRGTLQQPPHGRSPCFWEPAALVGAPSPDLSLLEGTGCQLCPCPHPCPRPLPAPKVLKVKYYRLLCCCLTTTDKLRTSCQNVSAQQINIQNESQCYVVYN